MFNNKILNKIVAQAKGKCAKIVLPEARYSADVLKAGLVCAEQEIAKIVVLAKNDNDFSGVDLNNVLNKDFFTIINISTYKNRLSLLERLCEIRKHKNLLKSEAEKLLKNEIYFATMLLETAAVDGMVVGAENTTSNSLRPPLQIIKGKKTIFKPKKTQARFAKNKLASKKQNDGSGKCIVLKSMLKIKNITKNNKYKPLYLNSIISSFFVMISNRIEAEKNKVLVLADCAINENPTAEQISTITFNTVNSVKKLLSISPKVALLCYSTKGSAGGVHPKKMRQATQIIQSKNPNFIIDGEFQLDASIMPEISAKKAPTSKLKGNANVLIFPDLSSGNIAYKTMQHIAGYTAIGPICQGFNKPVNDVSRGASWEDILLIISITSLQS